MASRAWQSEMECGASRRRFGRVEAGMGWEPGDRNAVPLMQSGGEKLSPLHPLHKTIDHLLLAGLLERDRQLVAVDLHHVAVAELLVKHAVVECELRNRAGGFCHQFAFDHHRAVLVAREAAARESISARAGFAARP